METENEVRVRISVDITPEVKRALKVRVAEDETSINEVVNELITNYLKK
jgi:predicted HicB family RNase H-like nuclease